jgi:hypothetical protein
VFGEEAHVIDIARESAVQSEFEHGSHVAPSTDGGGDHANAVLTQVGHNVVFMNGWIWCDAVAGSWPGCALPFLYFSACMLTYLLFSLLGCSGGRIWGANHAKVDGACLKLVVV